MGEERIPEEMVEKATFWNERVGRVDPTREGQPLRWWYGPLKASSDPNQKWCHDCYGVVEESDGHRWCRMCKASQPLLDDVIEAGADAATRELAPTWIKYPVGIPSVPDLRALIGEALSAALAGRQVVALPVEPVDRLAARVLDEHLVIGPLTGQCRCGWGDGSDILTLGQRHSVHVAEELRAAGVLAAGSGSGED